jgi:hypothetical protein
LFSVALKTVLRSEPAIFIVLGVAILKTFAVSIASIAKADVKWSRRERNANAPHERFDIAGISIIFAELAIDLHMVERHRQ